MDYSALSDTQLAQALHRGAEQLAAAKAAGDVAQVKALWAEFQDVAAEYASRDQLSGLDAFINQVHDGVEAFLADLAGTAGNIAKNAIKPLLVPLVILVVLAVVVVFLWRKVKT